MIFPLRFQVIPALPKIKINSKKKIKINSKTKIKKIKINSKLRTVNF